MADKLDAVEGAVVRQDGEFAQLISDMRRQAVDCQQVPVTVVDATDDIATLQMAKDGQARQFQMGEPVDYDGQSWVKLTPLSPTSDEVAGRTKSYIEAGLPHGFGSLYTFTDHSIRSNRHHPNSGEVHV